MKNFSKSFHLKGEAVDLLHDLGGPLHLLALEAEEALGDKDCLFSNRLSCLYIDLLKGLFTIFFSIVQISYFG